MGRAAFLIIALATAAMAAMMTGSVAHDEFGIPLDTIRTDATQRWTDFCGRRLRVVTEVEEDACYGRSPHSLPVGQMKPFVCLIFMLRVPGTGNRR